jgi:acylglycerol lipase
VRETALKLKGMTTTCTRHDWKAPDGEVFSYSLWKAGPTADAVPRAVVVAVHGLSGAALDYEPLGSHLAKHGVATVAIELRGQGNDPVRKRRGDLAAIGDWFSDLSAFLALIHERYRGVSFYYYGESMGAALLTRFLAQARESELPVGLVLASPVVVVPGKPSWWQELVFRFFLLVSPGHRVDVTKFVKRDRDDPAKWVTRDETHRRWFETASHKIDSYTVRFFKCLFDLISGCMEAAPKINVPVLVIYAANDVFIPPMQVERFFDQLGSLEKELQFFPESYHLLLHDYDKAEVLGRIETWLLARMEQTGLESNASVSRGSTSAGRESDRHR